MDFLQVQRTISLTSENPSEAFFSADEDVHTSRSSSLRAADRLLHNPKKRFASDLSIGGGPTGLENKLSTHRSDYEIHTPEHRSISKRPQSTAELVSVWANFIFFFLDLMAKAYFFCSIHHLLIINQPKKK